MINSRSHRLAIVAASASLAVLVAGHTPATAAIAPYTADANTLHLYHFDEAPGDADPGNPIADFGFATAVPLTNTGGPDGRDNNLANGGGYGATAYTGFGSAFDILKSGTGNYLNTNSPTGGGVRTAGAVTQATLQGANGAFTYEALISTANLNDTQVIISHDGNMAGNSAGSTSRGFMLRIISGQLAFFREPGVGGSDSVAIPVTGDHAFVANEWFHVAVTYTGAEGAANNFTFYWTRLDSGAAQANAIGSATLAADFGTGSDGNWLGVGTGTRGEFRDQLKGLVDEVRISDIARTADGFYFQIPEPASALGLALVGGVLALGRRRGS